MALIRGVASRMQEMGWALRGRGLDVYMTSTVPKGSGLQPSAAFEVLLGTMLNELFWSGHCTPVELAQIGQYAENVFFGKPCGLMDQTALRGRRGGHRLRGYSPPGGGTAGRGSPRLRLRPVHSGLRCGTRGSDRGVQRHHRGVAGGLPRVRQRGAREVPEEAFLAELPHVRKAVGDRAVNRAFHVYGENRRVREEVQALRSGDFSGFLRWCGNWRSSAMYLQNIISPAARRRRS